MALLAAYMLCSDISDSLEKFLNEYVFDKAEVSVMKPEAADTEGFDRYISKYRSGLGVEEAAVKLI